MFTGSFPAQSNRADWTGSYYLWDETVGPDEYIDLTGCTITVTVAYQNNGGSILQATTDDDSVTLTAPGTFSWTFSANQMASLQPDSYAVGIIISQDVGDETKTDQFFIGTLPIVEGVRW